MPRILSEAGVKRAHIDIARAAIRELPAKDRALIAQLGIAVTLVDASSVGDGMLGATKVKRSHGGRLVPDSVRVAARLKSSGVESLHEVIQHELGHVIAVVRGQDRSEDAASQYARRY